MNRREFIRMSGLTTLAFGLETRLTAAVTGGRLPNILFCLADDWGFGHAGIHGDPVVKTPVFDRIAREGAYFEKAFVTSPSCSPSRASMLSGQWHWRLRQAANLYGPVPADVKLYTDLLEQAGYLVGFTRKGWGPGPVGERPRNPAGNKFKDFAAFLGRRSKTQPFCFWFGSRDPHRPYDLNSGERSGMKLNEINLPGCLPDSREVRGDMADYYFEVERFDREVGEHLKMLEDAGELDHTIVVISGDNGLPFPRCKCNTYDRGVHVPLAIRWPGVTSGGQHITDFVSLMELAPTFLDAASLPIPPEMCGKSLKSILHAGKSGRVDPARDHIFWGKERHSPAQETPDMGGYPCRGLRTDRFLLIRNCARDRWPAGFPVAEKSSFKKAYGDGDDSPTKNFMIAHKNDNPQWRKLYEAAFEKRPEFEMFDLAKDPEQLKNVANDPGYAQVFAELSRKLNDKLIETGDPRVTGKGSAFDAYPYDGRIRD